MTRRIVFAECIGTFGLVFAGTTAVVVHETTGAVTHVGVALVFGLAAAAMITAVGGVSGAHLNPAVTLALVAARRTGVAALATHIPAQLAGAIAASALVRLLFPRSGALGATLPAFDAARACAVEAVITAMLMLVILAVTDPRRRPSISPPAAIGAVVALAALFAGPVTGASMNPARSLAPALVSGHTRDLWLYLVSPPLGAMLAVPLWRALDPGPARPDIRPNPPEGR